MTTAQRLRFAQLIFRDIAEGLSFRMEKLAWLAAVAKERQS